MICFHKAFWNSVAFFNGSALDMCSQLGSQVPSINVNPIKISKLPSSSTVSWIKVLVGPQYFQANWTKNWDMEIWNSSIAKLDTWNKKLMMRPSWLFSTFLLYETILFVTPCGIIPWHGEAVLFVYVSSQRNRRGPKHFHSTIWIAAFGDVELLKSANC